MFELIVSLALAIVALYNSVMYLQLTDEEKSFLESRWKDSLALSIFIIVVLSVVSVFEILKLYQILAFGTVGNFLSIYTAVAVMLLIPSAFLLYDVLSIKNSFRNFAPKIDLKAVLLIQGFAVFWLYLSFIEEKYAQVVYLFSQSLKAIFIVSLILIFYVSFLLYRYFKLLRRGDIIVQIDISSYLFQLNVAISLFGFYMLTQSTYCGQAVCAILIASFGILLNNALSSLGRALKQNVGGYAFEI
ncbi:hypothetical protein Ferp_0655 [Ferroglobus placidus DSM 10642]|uniref:Uncharacterized protein n=1 Tax=Ferroglobus placidus (strain DSM 10642 / AEDII12DO) TaxID=589924 RepID=D3S3J3_FERPA|nr:hypothetical protein [Ferroglobus placidus]ADC64826.1 hypothetical protein Ferp_0655 [Ferroglobus placidus DSM 10642]